MGGVYTAECIVSRYFKHSEKDCYSTLLRPRTVEYHTVFQC
jgi:hypothetical protein